MTTPTTPNTFPAPPSGYQQAPNNGAGLAITALVLGCCSVFFFWLYAIVPVLAIIFGSVSIGQSNKAGRDKPHGMAIAGLVLGVIFTMLFVLIIVLAAIA